MHFFFVILVLLVFSGCAGNSGFLDLLSDKPVSKEARTEYGKQKQANAPKKEVGQRILYINAKTFRYYDYVTFGVNRRQDISIELFASGKTIGTIEINKHRICILKDCARKWPAAKSFFGSVSYGDLFDDIFFGRDIFDGVGKVIDQDGALIQRFQKNGEIIYYRRTATSTLFKNMNNGVTISFDKYQEPKIIEEDDN